MLRLNPQAPPELRPLLNELIAAVEALRRPGAPSLLYACAAADLPPAGDWPGGLVLLRDFGALAVSDGTAWVRQDTGEAI